MPKEILSHERAVDVYAPKDLVVDQSTARRLAELCFEITNTCGLIEAILQLALEFKSKKQAAYIKTALYLSARGTKSVKVFLSEWSVLVEESRRENPGRSPDSAIGEPDLALILNSVTAHDVAIKNEVAPLGSVGDRKP